MLMRQLLSFIKTTIIGGLFFLVPIVALSFVLEKANAFMKKFAAPLANYIPIDNFAGLATASIIGWLMLALLCFFAGLLAKSSSITNFVKSFEEKLLSFIPGYGEYINTLESKVRKKTKLTEK